MTLGAVQPVAGQVSMRLHAGAALPAAGFGDFYEPGVALRFDVAYPIRDRLDLVADLGMDYVNGRTGTYVPDTHLWSFQVGLETDLLAAGTESNRGARPVHRAARSQGRLRRGEPCDGHAVR